MSKGGTSAPPAPDLGALEQQQGISNLATAAEQAGLNNVNTSSPFGSSSYTPYGSGQFGIGPQGYTLNQTLAPGVSDLFGTQLNLASTLANQATGAAPWIAPNASGASSLIAGALNGPGSALPTGGLNFNNAPAMPTGINFSGLATLPSQDFSSETTNAANAAYNTQEGYLKPQQAEQTEATNQQLADEGISPGSDAYDRAQGDLSRAQTFQNQQAQNAAVTAGNAEQQALYGEQLQGAQLGTGQQEANVQAQQEARQEAVNEALQQYQAPANVLSSEVGTGEGILSAIPSDLSGFAGLGNFQATGTVPTMGGSPTTVTPPNIGSLAGAANTGAFNRFAAGNTLNSQLGNALGSLGGSNLLFGSGGISNALGLGSGGIFGSLFGGAAASAPIDSLLGGTTSAGAALLL
jgi:hypothetical protein